jgi:peptidoglycan/LPS O-acetylase OafA/YrhL
MAVLTHWQLLPPLMQKYDQEDGLSYLLYLIGGGVVACHLQQADAWVRGHARLVFTLTAVAALAAEAVYFLAHYGVTTALGSGSDPFQPSLIPFNAGAIACGYLAGVALVRPGRSRFTRAVVRSGSDNAFGIYLTHMLVITVLLWLGWRNLDAVVPWPLLCLLTVGIIIACCVPLTALLARTPLAVPLTGRRRVPWRPPGWNGLPDASASVAWLRRRASSAAAVLSAGGRRAGRYRDEVAGIGALKERRGA